MASDGGWNGLPKLNDAAGLVCQVGSGRVETEGAHMQLSIAANGGDAYNNAQIDDYHQDTLMRWRPPVQLHVRARFSHAESYLRGTAGFGFWNDPFAMTKTKGHRRWRLPQSVWFFFASRPSDMPLAMQVPGAGWKAATLDASTLLARLLMPFAPFGMLANQWEWMYQRLWPVAQRVLKINEVMIPVALDQWHDYRLDWGVDGVHFWVDGVEILRTDNSPRGPLGFVTWIDNQYLVATPRGRIRHGLVATDEQCLELEGLEIQAG